MDTNTQLIEENQQLKQKNEALEKKIKKLDSRLNSIMKINDRSFKDILDKNTDLEKIIYRFNRILNQSDKQSKSILLQKDEQEEILLINTRMALMGELIDYIAHQWKQPLNTIAIVVQNLALNYSQNNINDNTIETFEKDCLAQIQYMSDTINDFRNFLKDDKRLSTFNIKDTLLKMEPLVQNLIMMKFIKLEIDLPLNNPTIYGIENELIQVFISFITNSIDAFNNQNKKFILINIEEDKENLYIHFKDNAGGVDPKILHEIFNPKFTTKSAIGGTGMGLYISKKIIKDTFHGELYVKNETFIFDDEKYQGVNFTIHLPK